MEVLKTGIIQITKSNNVVACIIDEQVLHPRTPDENDDNDGAPFLTSYIVGKEVDWLMFCNRGKG